MKNLFSIFILLCGSLTAQNYYYPLDGPAAAAVDPSNGWYFEAEDADFIGSTFEKFRDSRASAGMYVVAPKYPFENPYPNYNHSPDNDKDKIEFVLPNCEAGRYTVWVRGKVEISSNTFWVAANNSSEAYEGIVNDNSEEFSWTSSHGGAGISSPTNKLVFDFKEGTNTLQFYIHEKGYQLDRIFITKEEDEPANNVENRNIVTTSAGVYNSEEVLVRTLWNNVPKDYESTRETPEWDGRDDEGRDVPQGDYHVKITSNNVKYEWEGVVGNTSDDFAGGRFYIGSYARIMDMTIEGNYGYLTLGYNEGENNPSSFKINLANPYDRIELHSLNPFNRGQESWVVCSDANTVYWGGYDPYADRENFVFGTKVSDDSFRIFNSGSSYRPPSGNTTFPSIISRVQDQNGRITGMDVQRNGNYLFVAHRDLNLIKVYNKTTGALVRDISSFSEPFRLSIDTNGNGDLWVGHSSGVEKFRINTDGSLSSTGIIIAGNEALAIGGEHDGNTVSIIDGKSQQVKTYNTSDGSLTRTFGQLNAYAESPEVEDTKFMFGSSQNEHQPHKGITFVAYESDNSVWLNDTWNHRVQHFNGDKLEHSLMTQDPLKQVSIDPNHPERLFYYYHEFEIDYSKPFANFNGSWKLKRNWRGNLDSHERDGLAEGFKRIATLSNGRTYAQIESTTKNGNDRFFEIVELDTEKGIRYTGLFQSRFGEVLNYDGTLRPRGSKSGDNSIWYKREVTGFDAENNPIWGGKETLAVVQNITLDEPYNFSSSYISSPLPEVTPEDVIIAYNSDIPSNGGTNYHLGGVKVGDNKYLWKTSKNTPEGYSGNYPTDGRFDIGNGVNQNSGGVCVTIEDHVFWNYRGEFWKQAQTNYWQHFNANTGAMLGLFGTHVKEVPVKGQAGNAFSGGIVKVGEDYYLYHNGEDHHYGVHRWKISNLDSVEERRMPISTGN
ncbi:hypothetical protein RM549_03465 [Salegentibacter sp. F188]|uniref:Uncharacterized protein n=1 Tax=Autumnicola patrickiae TaxID=3075591 RepID=A0ABU3DYS5_9FLAO|nr:hypothetical protein [Salegentibacter sp. F188]MDT0688825.1 hypothetical protein [Salegentibacter sp. F188]